MARPSPLAALFGRDVRKNLFLSFFGYTLGVPKGAEGLLRVGFRWRFRLRWLWPDKEPDLVVRFDELARFAHGLNLRRRHHAVQLVERNGSGEVLAAVAPIVQHGDRDLLTF